MLSVFKFGKDTWDPTHRFETSWLLPPLALFACRAVISLYIFTARFFVIGWDCTHEESGGCKNSANDFSYFTVLTYWGLAFYFLFAAVHTITYALSGGRAALLDRFPRPLQALHSLFYTTVVTFPLLVTIVYWAILYEGPWFARRFDAWRGISQHALNTVFAVFEIVVPRTAPMPWIHSLWLILILALYLALAYLTHYTKGFYTYSFLNPKKDGPGTTAGYVLGIAVAILVIFVVIKALVWVRKWATEKKMGKEGKFAKPRAGRDVEMGQVAKGPSGEGNGSS